MMHIPLHSIHYVAIHHSKPYSTRFTYPFYCSQAVAYQYKYYSEARLAEAEANFRIHIIISQSSIPGP